MSVLKDAGIGDGLSIMMRAFIFVIVLFSVYIQNSRAEVSNPPLSEEAKKQILSNFQTVLDE